MVNDMIFVGELLFSDDLYTEDVKLPTKIKKLKEARVVLHTNDNSKIPHFHVMDPKTNFESCFEVFRPIYANHDEIKHSFMNKKQLEDLDKFLSGNHKNDEGRDESLSNWEYIKNTFFEYFPDEKRYYDFVVKPDYTRANAIKDYRSGTFNVRVKSTDGKQYGSGIVLNSPMSAYTNQPVFLFGMKGNTSSEITCKIKRIINVTNQKGECEEIWICTLSSSTRCNNDEMKRYVASKGYKNIYL